VASNETCKVTFRADLQFGKSVPFFNR
jgi:hypothetical protein